MATRRSMRIMHIVSSAASGGAEVYVKDLSRHMAKRGHRVFIVFIDRASETGRDAVFEAAYLNELRAHGIEYGFLGQACRKNPVRGVWRLRRFSRDFRPQIVHSHIYYAGACALLLPGVKRLYTHHSIKLKAPAWAYRIFDLGMGAYVGICRACHDMLASVTKRPVEQIDNGADLARLIPKTGYAPSVPLKLLFVGRLAPPKNLGLLIQAVANLHEAPIQLTVAGEGSLAGEHKALVKRLEVEDKIQFIGISNRVGELMNEADLFVMSSAWEGLPISQIEATLTGLPVLVTDVGGCREIVERVGNGLVAKVELEDYTAKLKQLIEDAELRHRCHLNALANAEHYTINSAVARHLSLYARLLSE